MAEALLPGPGHGRQTRCPGPSSQVASETVCPGRCRGAEPPLTVDPDRLEQAIVSLIASSPRRHECRSQCSDRGRIAARDGRQDCASGSRSCIGVAMRNRPTRDQDRYTATLLETEAGLRRTHFRLNALSLRQTRDHAVRRTVIETEWIGEGGANRRHPRLLIAAIFLLSELFGPVALVSLDLARLAEPVGGRMSD